MKSDYNMIINNNENKNNNYLTIREEIVKNNEKYTIENYKTKSFTANLDSDIAEKFKLPNILNKSSKFEQTKFEKKILSSEKPKFINFFDNKKEAQNLFKIHLLTKKFKIENEKTQTSPRDPIKDIKSLSENSEFERVLPNINPNQYKNTNFNSLYKSFNDNFNNTKEKNEFNSKLSQSEIEKEGLYRKKAINTNVFLGNSKDDMNYKHKNFKKGKIYPAKLIIKKYEFNDFSENINLKDSEINNILFNSMNEIKKIKLKNLKSSNSSNCFFKSKFKLTNKSLEFFNKRNNIVKEKERQLTNKIKILKNILEIENKDNIHNKSYLSISPDKDRINIDEITENFDCETNLSKRSCINRLFDKSNSFIIEEKKKIKINKLLSSGINLQNIDEFIEKEINSKENNKKYTPRFNRRNHERKNNSTNDNHFNKLSVSDSISYLNKSIATENEDELKLGMSNENISERAKNKLENKIGKIVFDNRTRNINNFSGGIISQNNVKDKSETNNSCNFSCGVNFGDRKEKNYNNYNVKLFEETQKLKFKLDNFIKNDINKLVNNEFLEEKFRGVVFHEKSEFDYQTKREFLLFAFICSKFEERTNFKKNALGFSNFPVPGGEYKIVHTGISTITIKKERNDYDKDYDIFKNSKNNYFKLIQYYNNTLEDIINKLKKNISEIIRYFSSLNCLKINNMNIDFQFMFLYVLKSENLFADRKIIFKMLEFFTKENNYAVNFQIFYLLRGFSMEINNDLTIANYYKHVNLIRSFLKYYLNNENQKNIFTKLLDEFKSSLGITEFDINFLIAEDTSDLVKNGDIYNIRIKVSNIYLSLIKLIT